MATTKKVIIPNNKLRCDFSKFFEVVSTVLVNLVSLSAAASRSFLYLYSYSIPAIFKQIID